MDSRTVRYNLVVQRELNRVDARRSRSSKAPRSRLIAPVRSSERQAVPAWSPRALSERRPLRRIRCRIGRV